MSNTNLRWLLVTAAALMILPVINADVPNLMSYQGRLTDADGVPLTGTYDLIFGIYTAQSGGILEWTENHNNVEVTDGLFSVILGSQGQPLNSSPFGSGFVPWLEIRVDGEVIGDRSQLTSVPYAQKIATVDGAAGGLVYGTLTTTEEVQVGGVLVPLGGSIWNGPSITMESANGNIMIIAGTSQITVSPTGGVTISAADVTINATDVLTLSAGTEVAIEAPTVDVHATSTLGLRSDAMVAVDAATSTTIDAGGTTTINGSALVDINGGLVQIN